MTEYSIKKFKSPQNLAPKRKKGGWGKGGGRLEWICGKEFKSYSEQEIGEEE